MPAWSNARLASAAIVAGFFVPASSQLGTPLDAPRSPLWNSRSLRSSPDGNRERESESLLFEQDHRSALAHFHPRLSSSASRVYRRAFSRWFRASKPPYEPPFREKSRFLAFDNNARCYSRDAASVCAVIVSDRASLSAFSPRYSAAGESVPRFSRVYGIIPDTVIFPRCFPRVSRTVPRFLRKLEFDLPCRDFFPPRYTHSMLLKRDTTERRERCRIISRFV